MRVVRVCLLLHGSMLKRGRDLPEWRPGRLDIDDSGRCENSRDAEWWSKGDRRKGFFQRWHSASRALTHLPLSCFLVLRIWQVESAPPLPSCCRTHVLRHAALTKVAVQSDVFLLLPWLYFMLSCLFSLFISVLAASSYPLVFSFFLLLTKSKQKLKLLWRVIACISTFHLRVYTLYPKSACFMHCVGGKCILKYHASFESFSSENAKSLFGPSVPSRPAVCTYSVVALRLACDFRHFPRVDFSHLRGSLGATDDRLLSRCKLTFRFHN